MTALSKMKQLVPNRVFLKKFHSNYSSYGKRSLISNGKIHESIFMFSQRVNLNKSICLKQIKHQSTSQINTKQSNFSINLLKYILSICVGAGAGVLTGYYLISDENKNNLKNESSNFLKPTAFEATQQIVNNNPKYKEFPLSIHLYQYETCPYCSQIRAYLDFFGFDYTITEVDSYTKSEISSFTRARQLPILVLEDKITKSKWHLANSTAILSAFESIRNNKHIYFADILQQYLPILKGNILNSTSNPYKYHVSNSDLNSIEWRRWINNTAIPAFKINSVCTSKDLFETFDYYAEKSGWNLRYNKLKYIYVYYRNALRTYSQYSKSLDQLRDKKVAPRDLLKKTINTWEEGLGEKMFIDGNRPNLADISMFGNVRSYQGCEFFRDAMEKNKKFQEWYERMNLALINGFKEPVSTQKSFFSLKSVNENESNKVTNQTKKELADKSVQVTKQDVEKTVSFNKSNINNSKHNNDPKQIEMFRVLSITYILHVILFTYAAWMSNK